MKVCPALVAVLLAVLVLVANVGYPRLRDPLTVVTHSRTPAPSLPAGCAPPLGPMGTAPSSGSWSASWGGADNVPSAAGTLRGRGLFVGMSARATAPNNISADNASQPAANASQPCHRAAAALPPPRTDPPCLES